MTATGTPSEGHQTDVALSKHRTWRVCVRARLASALMLSLLLASLSSVAPARGVQSGEGDGQGFLNIALPPGGEARPAGQRLAHREPFDD